ncbi:MAG: DUF2735 domain-containing protein [Xanthobacteraceae bacterium]
MTATNSGSAKIYAFPPRGRYALRVQGDDPAPKVQLPYGVKLVSGASGWYHDEAIRSAAETDRGRKN